jgi:hypothetical protein
MLGYGCAYKVALRGDAAVKHHFRVREDEIASRDSIVSRETISCILQHFFRDVLLSLAT